VAIFQDLTEIKELQRQVLQQEKMASIGQLAAGIAHEINNPVGFIHANLAQMAEYLADLSGFLDMVGELQQALSSGVESEVKRASAALEETASRIDVDYVRKDFGNALRESLEGSERIRHIVSDLRQFSHRGGVETTLADINQCVDSTANIVWTMMKHSVELEKDYQDLPLLRCHPMQIEQVFMNLLVNAYQSIEEALADSPEEIGTIGIATRERDGGIEVRITDTGSGISAGDLQRIFDPFYTTKEVGVGTGLGLSTSYGIVKQHGGEIEVSSEPGRGSCFAVWLPLGSDKEPGQSETTSARSH
jgi:two-component system NtrC family sensor kinase